MCRYAIKDIYVLRKPVLMHPRSQVFIRAVKSMITKNAILQYWNSLANLLSSLVCWIFWVVSLSASSKHVTSKQRRCASALTWRYFNVSCLRGFGWPGSRSTCWSENLCEYLCRSDGVTVSKWSRHYGGPILDACCVFDKDPFHLILASQVGLSGAIN